ncbi:hypothetical protein Tco_0427314 [Tanacetum coccineum]
MDPNSSLGKICLGEDVVVISSDKVEGSGDCNFPEFQDTANIKRGNKVVKKELIVALRGEIYFVKFIINLEEDDVEPGVIFGRSFLRMTKMNTMLGEEGLVITRMQKWGRVAIIRSGQQRTLTFFYQDIGTSSSAGGHFTQEHTTKEAITIRMSQKFALLEEERPIIKTMAYNDKYKKILDEVWKDKVELDGKIVKEEEEAVKNIKGEALKEKKNLVLFIFP